MRVLRTHSLFSLVVYTSIRITKGYLFSLILYMFYIYLFCFIYIFITKSLKYLTNCTKCDRGYLVFGARLFGKKIKKPIIHLHHYTYNFSPLCSTMLNKLISKIYLWITMWITLCITMFQMCITLWKTLRFAYFSRVFMCITI